MYDFSNSWSSEFFLWPCASCVLFFLLDIPALPANSANIFCAFSLSVGSRLAIFLHPLKCGTLCAPARASSSRQARRPSTITSPSGPSLGRTPIESGSESGLVPGLGLGLGLCVCVGVRLWVWVWVCWCVETTTEPYKKHDTKTL